jgi:hypothetical protein
VAELQPGGHNLYATRRNASTCRKQRSSWFQLTKMRLTIRLTFRLLCKLKACSWQAIKEVEGEISHALNDG